MDTTFITIHDLSEDANILYCSDSIVDILGFTPDEVVDQPAWNFFHRQDIDFAKAKHSRGVKLDKAAVLAYVGIRNREGNYVGCECCFSVVYDVMVCCISIYRHGIQSQKRAVEAPIVRRLFASSPKDPRYHMLSHLSNKFSLGEEEQTHEPRAALFLNRFTRSLAIMYATSGIEQIIGIPSDDMRGRSFYYCIQENCLREAMLCLESAKGNDSIAYMRFLYRDPRQPDPPPEATTSESEDEAMTDVTGSEDESEAGGVDSRGPSTSNSRSSHGIQSDGTPSNTRADSGSSSRPSEANNTPPGEGSAHRSSTSSLQNGSSPSESRDEPIELEAVISCTSDGLVVCLRRARPMVPTAWPVTQATHTPGIFAAPWAPQPVFHPPLPQPPPFPLGAQHPAMYQAGPPAAFQNAFMQSIRDVAVFAWALTGINGSLAEYAKGNPTGESQPPEGFPIWSPEVEGRKFSAAPSGYVSGTSSSSNDPFGDPGLS